MGELGEFVIKLFAEVGDLTGLKGLSTAISGITLGGAATLLFMDRLVHAMFKLGREGLTTAAHYRMLNQVFGINTQWLQKMQYLGVQHNVTAKQTQESIVGLTTNLAAFSLGMGSQAFMQAAGFLGLKMRPGMTAADIMEQLKGGLLKNFINKRESMGDKNARAEAALLLSELGMSPAMIQDLTGQKAKMSVHDQLTTQQIKALTTLNNTIEDWVRAFKFGFFGGVADLVMGTHPGASHADKVGAMINEDKQLESFYKKEFGPVFGPLFSLPSLVMHNLAAMGGIGVSSNPGNVTQNNTIHVHGGTHEMGEEHAKLAEKVLKRHIEHAAILKNPASR
ncbi:MAG: hypothetical protein KGJ13_04660 [Patescibacteria group bacterium]|nr:hypothetical protein [Patescibacteria group bacterium]